MEPVNQRDAREILDEALELRKGCGVGDEFRPLNGDPTSPVSVPVGEDPFELFTAIDVRDFAGPGTGRFQDFLEAEKFGILRVRFERFRNEGTSLDDVVVLNQRTNSCGIVAGGVHRLALEVLPYGH